MGRGNSVRLSMRTDGVLSQTNARRMGCAAFTSQYLLPAGMRRGNFARISMQTDRIFIQTNARRMGRGGFFLPIIDSGRHVQR